MTVAELRLILAGLPDEAPIVVREPFGLYLPGGVEIISVKPLPDGRYTGPWPAQHAGSREAVFVRL